MCLGASTTNAARAPAELSRQRMRMMRTVGKPYALSSAAHCSLALLPVSPQFGTRIPSHRCVSDAWTDYCEYCQVRCFRKSAEKDCTVAQLMLARCYEQGMVWYLQRPAP